MKMSRADRIFCWFLSVLAAGMCLLLLIRVAHTWQDRLMVAAVGFALTRYPWISIPQDSRRIRIEAAICGDESGPDGVVCTLEPGHRGDHKSFHSSGGCIGWPRKGGA